jgi:hypothetical protein
LGQKKVDVDWEPEYEMAMRYNMNILLFNYDIFKTDGMEKSFGIVDQPTSIQPIYYRGWRMPVRMYKKFYSDLLDLNFRLINAPDKYEHCYYLPRSYNVIKNETAHLIFYSEYRVFQLKQVHDLRVKPDNASKNKD